MAGSARPEIRRFLDELDELAAPPLAELGVPGARAAMVTSCREFWGEPEPVAYVQDHRGDFRIRSYRPVRSTLPGVVFFHGGGFVTGSIETHDGFCCRLANAAHCAVFSIGYRLAPEHPFPAASQDAVTAAAWIHDHALLLSVDRARLSVAGDSAGGNLAAIAARELARRSMQLASQVLIYPVAGGQTDTCSYEQNADGCFLTRRDMCWFLEHYASVAADRVHPDLAPLQAEDLTGLPPAYIATCELDPLRDDGTSYAERLRAAGVSVTLEDWPGMIHGFLLMRTVTPAADELLDHVVDFLGASWDPQGGSPSADPLHTIASRV